MTETSSAAPAKKKDPSPVVPLLFDAREERVVAGLSRWMGLLGRFQIIAASFVFLLVLAVGALVLTAEFVEPVTRTGSDAPLVEMGKVSRETIGIAVAIVVVFSLIFFRGGMLLIGAAEDFDAVNAREQSSHLETALSRARRYFILEAFLFASLAALAYATVFGWPVGA
jgi:hypothetical protein